MNLQLLLLLKKKYLVIVDQVVLLHPSKQTATRLTPKPSQDAHTSINPTNQSDTQPLSQINSGPLDDDHLPIKPTTLTKT